MLSVLGDCSVDAYGDSKRSALVVRYLAWLKQGVERTLFAAPLIALPKGGKQRAGRCYQAPGQGKWVWGKPPPFGFSQSTVCRGMEHAAKTANSAPGNLNDTPSRDPTLAIKIPTTTPVLHRKIRQIGFAWHRE